MEAFLKWFDVWRPKLIVVFVALTQLHAMPDALLTAIQTHGVEAFNAALLLWAALAQLRNWRVTKSETAAPTPEA